MAREIYRHDMIEDQAEGGEWKAGTIGNNDVGGEYRQQGEDVQSDGDSDGKSGAVFQTRRWLGIEQAEINSGQGDVLLTQDRDDAEIVVLKCAPKIAEFERKQTKPCYRMTRYVIARLAAQYCET